MLFEEAVVSIATSSEYLLVSNIEDEERRYYPHDLIIATYAENLIIVTAVIVVVVYRLFLCTVAIEKTARYQDHQDIEKTDPNDNDPLLSTDKHLLI